VDDYAGEFYKAVSVTALTTKDSEDGTQQETIEADMYVWNGDMAEPSPEPWGLGTLHRRTRLVGRHVIGSCGSSLVLSFFFCFFSF